MRTRNKKLEIKSTPSLTKLLSYRINLLNQVDQIDSTSTLRSFLILFFYKNNPCQNIEFATPPLENGYKRHVNISYDIDNDKIFPTTNNKTLKKNITPIIPSDQTLNTATITNNSIILSPLTQEDFI